VERRELVERVAGVLEVYLTRDGSKIAISQCGVKADAIEMSRIVLSPRQARHLANVLIMHSDEAEEKTDERLASAGRDRATAGNRARHLAFLRENPLARSTRGSRDADRRFE
jgi:hypothetical protein